MKKIFTGLLFSLALILCSCSKNNPQPTCEQGGEEITP